MKTVADDKDRIPAFRVDQVRCGPDTVVCCAAPLLRHNFRDLDAPLNEIIRADLSLGKIRIGTVAAGRDNRVRESLRV